MRVKRFVFNSNSTCGHIAVCSASIHTRDFNMSDTILAESGQCNFAAIVAVISFEVVLSLCIVIGNLLILYIMSNSAHFANPQGMIKTSLAASDFLVGAIVLPSTVANKVHILLQPLPESYIRYLDGTKNTIASCIFGMLFSICISASLFSLMLLTIDRILAVHWPMEYHQGKLMTRRLSFRLVVATWCLSVFMGILPLGDLKRFSYNIDYMTMTTMLEIEPNPAYNPPTITHGIFFLVLVFVLPYACVVVITIVTWLKLTRTKHLCCVTLVPKARKLSIQAGASPLRVNDFERITVTIFIMVLAFSVCVVPFLAAQIENLYVFSVTPIDSKENKTGGCNPMFYLVAAELLYGNSLCNFVIYNLRNELFKKELGTILHKRRSNSTASTSV